VSSTRNLLCALALLATVLSTTAAARAVSGGAAATAAAAPSDPIAFCADTLGGELWARTELYFGLSRSGAPNVTEQEFQRFVDTVVTPRFPDGLTVLAASGQFRGSDGAVLREPAKVIVLFYPWAPARNRAIERIRARYKELFDQQSVLRTDDVSCVSF
jgi:hypothetical protein